MTCIAGIVTKNKVYLGGDSAGTNTWFSATVVTNEKVFANGRMLIGGCGSFRMLNLLRYAFKPPAIGVDQDTYEYMVTDFMDAIRDCFKKHGFLHKEDGVEDAGNFLVAFDGRLFEVQTDLSVLESVDGYAAIGSGEDLALGSLFTTNGKGMDPEKRLTLALEAAEKFNAGVRRPFHIESLERGHAE